MNYVSSEVPAPLEEQPYTRPKIFQGSSAVPVNSADPVMQHLLRAVTAALEARSDDRRSQIDRSLEELHGVLVRPAGRNNAVSGLAPWQMRKVRQHIESGLSGPIRVDGLATIAKLSSSHFSRAFKASYGTTPATYVSAKRVELAKTMMLGSDKPLCQIGLDCGFTDQAHLSRVFRRWTGQSPSAWRREHRQA